MVVVRKATVDDLMRKATLISRSKKEIHTEDEMYLLRGENLLRLYEKENSVEETKVDMRPILEKIRLYRKGVPMKIGPKVTEKAVQICTDIEKAAKEASTKEVTVEETKVDMRPILEKIMQLAW